jgi:hypothetical protein
MIDAYGLSRLDKSLLMSGRWEARSGLRGTLRHSR